MTDAAYKAMVAALIAQGVVQDEAEARRRLLSGEKLLVQCRVDNAKTWRGIMELT